MLLMCQEFDMASCIRLWDSLFADSSRFELLYFVSVAYIQLVRDEILHGDFSKCMEALQN